MHVCSIREICTFYAITCFINGILNLIPVQAQAPGAPKPNCTSLLHPSQHLLLLPSSLITTFCSRFPEVSSPPAQTSHCVSATWTKAAPAAAAPLQPPVSSCCSPPPLVPCCFSFASLKTPPSASPAASSALPSKYL